MPDNLPDNALPPSRQHRTPRAIDSLDSLPVPQGRIVWNHLTDYLRAQPDLGFVGEITKKDIGSMNGAPPCILTVVKVLDEWDTSTVGRAARWQAVYSFGLRLYVWDDGSGEQHTEQVQDWVEAGTEVLMQIITSGDFRTQQGFWYEAVVPARTTIYGKVGERAFSTTRLQLKRQFDRNW